MSLLDALRILTKLITDFMRKKKTASGEMLSNDDYKVPLPVNYDAGVKSPFAAYYDDGTAVLWKLERE